MVEDEDRLGGTILEGFWGFSSEYQKIELKLVLLGRIVGSWAPGMCLGMAEK